MSESSVVVPLEPSIHDRTSFSCGAEPLDRYLRQQASQDQRSRVAAVFVLCEPGSREILGYYTLCAAAVDPESLPEDIRRRLPRYRQLPDILIGRLAVDQRRQGHGWGRVLLQDTLRRCLAQTTHVAAMAVVVDAKDDDARGFYESRGFRRFLDEAYRLYMPMATIAKLFGRAQ